ncbi:MAG: hypothetical protein JST67_02810 [Bacteroidetes bacterium]|nr:hypothetical protein [Bacteroidota bacterium]
MKTKLFFLLCVYFGFAQIKAQDSLCFNKKYVAKNNVTAEALGTCILYSINYERNFCIKEKIFHTFRTGLSYWDLIYSETGYSFYIPMTYSFNLGKKRNKFFVGTGTTFMIATNPYPTSAAGRAYARQNYNNPEYSESYVSPMSIMFQPIFIGYQYISKKRFYFKVTATTLIIDDPLRMHFYFSPIPWGGVTFGFKLTKIKKEKVQTL